MANRRKLADYSESELKLIKETTIKSANYGFGLTQSCELVGLSLKQLQSLMDADSDFKTAYQAVKPKV